MDEEEIEEIEDENIEGFGTLTDEEEAEQVAEVIPELEIEED